MSEPLLPAPYGAALDAGAPSIHPEADNYIAKAARHRAAMPLPGT
ncbi:hypothetical protein [Sphaerisporangium sp. NPDC051011]